MSNFASTLTDTVKAYSLWMGLCARRLGCVVKSKEHNRVGLLLTATLPPGISGGVYRPAALLRYARQHSWEIAGVAEEDKDDPTPAGLTLYESLPSSTEIVRFKAGLRPSWRLMPQVDGGFARALEMTEAARFAIKKVKPAVVVASGPPFYTFISGYFIARASGIPLVLDYRDEWSECPFDFVSPARDNRIWEEACHKAATRIVFTTASQLAHNLRQFPNLNSEKCRVVENGWDEFYGANAEVSNVTPTGSITLSYLGALSEHSLPGSFLECLSNVLARDHMLAERLTIRFVGYKSSRALNQLNSFRFSNRLQLISQVSLPEAQRMMRNSDVLLLFSNDKLARYRPGKLYEYIASRSKILIYGCEGESTRLIRELEAGWYVADGDTGALESVLRSLVSQKASKVVSEKVTKWIEENSREKMAGRYYELLEEVIMSK